jgi:hypothetical protein
MQRGRDQTGDDDRSKRDYGGSYDLRARHHEGELPREGVDDDRSSRVSSEEVRVGGERTGGEWLVQVDWVTARRKGKENHHPISSLLSRKRRMTGRKGRDTYSL